jgi:hypothetical protein
MCIRQSGAVEHPAHNNARSPLKTSLVEEAAGRCSRHRRDRLFPGLYITRIVSTERSSRPLKTAFVEECFVSKWAYEVSVDGQSLIVSTTDQVVIFERV